MYHRLGHRSIPNNGYSAAEMLAELGYDTLEERASKIRLVMFYKILNNFIHIQTI